MLPKVEIIIGCLQASPGGCGWPRVAPGGSGWLQVAAGGSGRLREAPGGSGRLRVAPGGILSSGWLRVAAGGSGRLRVAPEVTERSQKILRVTLSSTLTGAISISTCNQPLLGKKCTPTPLLSSHSTQVRVTKPHGWYDLARGIARGAAVGTHSVAAGVALPALYEPGTTLV